MVYKKSEIAGGGTTPLGSQEKGFGGIGCVKILRYYDTKAVRRNIRNSNVAQHSYVQDDKKPHFTHVKKAAFTLAGGATHVDMSDNIRRVAFTLAEVLITLGIIGIVAALTIPTLVSNYQKKVLEAQFKKTYAVASQIILRAKADLETGSLGQYCTVHNGSAYINENNCMQAFYKVMMPKKSGVGGYDLQRADISSFNNRHSGLSSADLGGMSYALFYTDIMPDGTYMNVNINEFYINFGVDINGAKGPNKLGWDIFLFRVDKGNDSLAGIRQTREYTDEELEEIDFSNSPINQNRYGYPCNLNSSMKGNGIGCSWYALNNICPWDNNKTYWQCLTK